MKKIIIVIFILILITSCQYLPPIGGEYDSIKDINQNPESYLDKHVIVKGKLQSRLGGPSMAGEEGYWIWLDEKTCEENHRDYLKTQYYVAEGTIKSIPELVGNRYTLSCSTPLS